MKLEDPTPKLYGLLAEFDSATAIVTAARKAREAGYVKVDAYTPFPIHELDDALQLPRTKLPWIVLVGGITGTLAGLGLQVLGLDHRLSLQRRRPALCELAGVRHSGLRDNHSVRGVHDGYRDDSVERVAATVPSDLQRAGIFHRVSRPILSVRRDGRPEVRWHGDAKIPAGAAAPGSDRRCRLTLCSPG